MPGYEIVLLDVEGTTTPISFVHDVLFPYITNNMHEFLAANWDDPMVQTHVQAIAEQANKDVQDGLPLATSIDLASDTAAAAREKVVSNIKWQMEADRKIGALKGLQGYMWKTGYQAGELRGAMFRDAVDAMKRWSSKDAGRRVFIYSSGSVQAQKLIFGYSECGDLLPLIEGHFDTGIGSKLEAESYERISREVDVAPEKILFVSDNVRELHAAEKAGMQVVLSVRPGNAPVSEEEATKYHAVSDFMAIPL
ncbi:enolase-phosphatase E1 [Coemansia sp. Benny D115]|nr:enolase-phosphatase E1 [Coemansia sp. Benny D115]